MTGSRPDRGLRSTLPAACRAALREALGASDATAVPHLADCARCRQRVADARQLATLLRSRPDVPAELRSPSLIERIDERIVADAEAGPLRSRLQTRPAAEPVAERVAWPDAVAGDLARRVVQPPELPDHGVWERVRATIIADLRAPVRVNPRPQWLLGLAGVAAVAVIGAAIFAKGAPPPPKIVFVDIEHVPDVDFAVIRHGGPR